jgi:hypothetical protein
MDGDLVTATHLESNTLHWLKLAKDWKLQLENAFHHSNQSVPNGIFSDLLKMDRKLAAMIDDEENGNLSHHELISGILAIDQLKSHLVAYYPDVYGVPAHTAVLLLDYMDDDLVSATGLESNTLHWLKLAKDWKLQLEDAFHESNPSPSPNPSPRPNEPPAVSGIGATFYPAGTAGACEDTSTYPNNGETCYSVSASDPDGDTLGYQWSIAAPVQDPGCESFRILSNTLAVWHHGNSDGCDHTKEGPDGHEGTVSVSVTDGSYHCLATFLGTNTHSGPGANCAPQGKLVLTVTEAGIGTSGTGSGTVTSSPAGIDCGSTCSAGFAPATQVTLTATADASSTFLGWSGGGCFGTSTCTVRMNTDKTVMATFQHM